MSLYNTIYLDASKLTGRSEAQLRKMAEMVFATMLHHCMQAPGTTVTTVTLVDQGRIEIEVNVAIRNSASFGDARKS